MDHPLTPGGLPAGFTIEVRSMDDLSQSICAQFNSYKGIAPYRFKSTTPVVGETWKAYP